MLAPGSRTNRTQTQNPGILCVGKANEGHVYNVTHQQHCTMSHRNGIQPTVQPKPGKGTGKGTCKANVCNGVGAVCGGGGRWE